MKTKIYYYTLLLAMLAACNETDTVEPDNITDKYTVIVTPPPADTTAQQTDTIVTPEPEPVDDTIHTEPTPTPSEDTTETGDADTTKVEMVFGGGM